MPRLGVIGLPGKMAQRVCALAAPGELTQALARPDDPLVGQPAMPGGIAITPFSAGAFPHADVWIEFAHHTATHASTHAAVAANKPLLVCTTGLDDTAVQALRGAAKTIPVMLAPNTSLGVAALNAALRVALTALGPAYQAEIVELHHDRKKDAPSGTALRLADTILQTRGLARDALVTARTGNTGERTPSEIGVAAVRGGNVIGEHTVYLFGADDRLELTHRAHSRDLFATGALRAARWLVERPAGWYTIEHCLGLESA